MAKEEMTKFKETKTLTSYMVMQEMTYSKEELEVIRSSAEQTMM
jgi:hypothetical protein